MYDSLYRPGARFTYRRIQSYDNRKFRLVHFVMYNYSAAGTGPIYDWVHECIYDDSWNGPVFNHAIIDDDTQTISFLSKRQFHITYRNNHEIKNKVHHY